MSVENVCGGACKTHCVRHQTCKVNPPEEHRTLGRRCGVHLSGRLQGENSECKWEGHFYATTQFIFRTHNAPWSQTLSADALGRGPCSIAFVMIQCTFVGRLTLDVERITACTLHGRVECPFAHTPILLLRAPISLSRSGTEIFSLLAASYVFQAHVMRPRVPVVHAAYTVAGIPRRRHVWFAALLERSVTDRHVHISILCLPFFFGCATCTEGSTTCPACEPSATPSTVVARHEAGHVVDFSIARNAFERSSSAL